MLKGDTMMEENNEKPKIRNYKCQTITRSGVRCGKFAEHQTKEGDFVCQACWWKYIRGNGQRIEVAANSGMNRIEAVRK